jgi:hypothetical protein
MGSLAVAIAAFGLLLCAPDAQAQNNVADVWIVTPAADVGQGFEAALRDHMQWRTEAGDPWQWNVYSVETGSRVGTYAIRSSGHSWADFDAYDAGFGPEGGMRVAASFGPMIESVEHQIVVADTARTRMPADFSEINIIQVVTWNLRPGQDFNAAVDHYLEVIEENDLPMYYTFESVASGMEGGPSVMAAFFYRNWAEMGDPNEAFNEALEARYGDELQEVAQQFAATYRSMDTWVVRARRDLSMGGM